MGILALSLREFKDISRLYPALSYILLGPDLTFSISNRSVQFHVPLQLDESTGLLILPVLHFDLLPDELVSSLDLTKRRTSYGVYLRIIGTKDFVRALPYRLADYKLEAAALNYHSFRVFKSLSAENSAAMGRREIRVRKPADLEHPSFGLASVQPNSSWISSLRILTANQTDYFSASLYFRPI